MSKVLGRLSCRERVLNKRATGGVSPVRTAELLWELVNGVRATPRDEGGWVGGWLGQDSDVQPPQRCSHRGEGRSGSTWGGGVQASPCELHWSLFTFRRRVHMSVVGLS